MLDFEIGELERRLGVTNVAKSETYLGLPTLIGRKKITFFSVIKSRVKKQLATYTMFSADGREILIKAVVQAFPAYTMSLFQLPIMLMDELHTLRLVLFFVERHERQV